MKNDLKLVKCINSKSGYHLTIDKIYNVEICTSPISPITKKPIFDYYVTNDLGHKHGIENNPFIDISELRENKLKDLGC